MLGGYGAVGVQMSYFPELFGSRYRYAGVTLGREFSSVVGGGVAPLVCSALLSAYGNAWFPVAVYMMAMSLVSLVAVRLAPETLNRDLTLESDAPPRLAEGRSP
jgi:MFS family permease